MGFAGDAGRSAGDRRTTRSVLRVPRRHCSHFVVGDARADNMRCLVDLAQGVAHTSCLSKNSTILLHCSDNFCSRSCLADGLRSWHRLLILQSMHHHQSAGSVFRVLEGMNLRGAELTTAPHLHGHWHVHDCVCVWFCSWMRSSMLSLGLKKTACGSTVPSGLISGRLFTKFRSSSPLSAAATRVCGRTPRLYAIAIRRLSSRSCRSTISRGGRR